MTNRQRLCLAIVAYFFILAMGIGSLIVLFDITKPSRDGIAPSDIGARK